jgi:hypothetical protein
VRTRCGPCQCSERCLGEPTPPGVRVGAVRLIFDQLPRYQVAADFQDQVDRIEPAANIAAREAEQCPPTIPPPPAAVPATIATRPAPADRLRSGARKKVSVRSASRVIRCDTPGLRGARPLWRVPVSAPRFPISRRRLVQRCAAHSARPRQLASRSNQEPSTRRARTPLTRTTCRAVAAEYPIPAMVVAGTIRPNHDPRASGHAARTLGTRRRARWLLRGAGGQGWSPSDRWSARSQPVLGRVRKNGHRR